MIGALDKGCCVCPCYYSLVRLQRVSFRRWRIIQASLSRRQAACVVAAWCSGSVVGLDQRS